MVKNPYGNTLENPITRRTALKMLGGAAGMAGLSSVYPVSKLMAAPAANQPNIIFILTDDHRWDMLGVRGHPFLKTPHMDRLANEGILFKNAFVTTSLCSPSRASFLTGQYASVHGVQNNFSRWDASRNKTFLEPVKRAGHDTAFIGKWHMPGGGLPQLPGVDLFVSFTRKDGQGDYYDCPIFVNHKPVTNRKRYITEALTDYALAFIETERDRPFCMVLSHKAVHHDWKPPAHLKGKYKKADLSHLAPESDKYNTWTGLNWLEGTMGDMHTVYRNYCECLESVDEQLGRLLALLEKKGILDDTVIIYTSDNGYMWGEHRLYAKHHPYEESIRIPWLVRAPRYISEPGRQAEQMVLNIDLAPTLMALAGLPIPDHIQGESFMPILRGDRVSGREAFVYELFRDFPFGGRVPPHKAIRTRRYKYVDWERCRAPELYDLQTDSREMHNLLAQPRHLELAETLKRRLEELIQQYHLVRV